MTKIIIIGAGFGCLEVIEIVKDINDIKPIYTIESILDDNKNLIGKKIKNILISGTLEEAMKFNEDYKFVFAIGGITTYYTRKDIISNLHLNKNRFINLIHPSSKIYDDVSLGCGIIIHYGTIVYSNTSIGNFVVLTANCVIGVNNTIDDYALISSNVTSATNVKISKSSFIGSSTTINENVIIGEGAVTGIGTIVNRNINDRHILTNFLKRPVLYKNI